MGIMEKNKLTGDLFGVEDCEDCDGTGVVVTDLVFSDLWKCLVELVRILAKAAMERVSNNKS